VKGFLISLVHFVSRLAVGVGIALVFALLLALVRDDSSFAESLRIAAITVGCVSILLAFGGSSTSRRMDPDPYMAHYFPQLARHWEYSGAVLSQSAIFALVGIVLLAIGFVMPV
jgi:hypothetical protein